MKQFLDRASLVISVLDDQGRVRQQVGPGAAGDGVNGIQAAHACAQRQAWLEAHVAAAQVGIAAGHIGRIGDDERAAFGAERLVERPAPVALVKTDVVEA